jgi:site-specific DNA-methyltransferase (adenine-specific)
MESKIIQGECLDVLLRREIVDQYLGKISLIYIDPPFMTQKTQKLHQNSYEDKFDSLRSYIVYLQQRIEMALPYLKNNGSLFVHVDYRTVHHVKVMLDRLFAGPSCDSCFPECKNFMNEIIWAYDSGGRSKKCWSKKHDTILWYVNNPKDYIFNYEKIDRIPYMAPGLVGEEKAAKGKVPTDVWWNTIVPTNGKERQGYPTQKPLAILNRIIKVHTNPGDIVMDFFAGSGTTVVAAASFGRKYVAIDQNPSAIEIIKRRVSEIS